MSDKIDEVFEDTKENDVGCSGSTEVKNEDIKTEEKDCGESSSDAEKAETSQEKTECPTELLSTTNHVAETKEIKEDQLDEENGGELLREEGKEEDDTKKELKNTEKNKKSEDVEGNKEDDKLKKEDNSKSNGKKKEKAAGKENQAHETIGDRENFLDHHDMRRDAINRVKLYVLCDQRLWEDRGTGHVMCVNAADDDLPSNSSPFVIIVRLEAQGKNLLESRILMDTVYQKQQETLIVWSETDAMDLALSFQEKSGCEELWMKICEVQGRDPGETEGAYDDGDDSDVSELTSSSSRLALPPIETGRLSEIDVLIHMHLSTNTTREKMANAIENDNVIPKLCEVFRMCEDIGHTEGLRTFYSIAKNMFMLNRTSMIELLLDDKHIKELIGMFEFDPAYVNPRKHREFVYEMAKFREVLHLSNDELKEKIHRLYRAQYIQDACLPSLGLFEENLLSTLNSHIHFSRLDIVAMLQKDKKAMRELFGQLRSNDTDPSRRKDLVKFLKEMIQLSHNLPSTGSGQNKENFFKHILNNDILDGIEPSMRSSDAETRSTMVDVLRVLVDHNAQTIRDYLIRQARDKEDEDVLLNLLIQHMLTDKDPHLTSGTEVVLIIRMLLDPDNMTSVKTERMEFFQLFYNRCTNILLKPMLENISGGVIKKDDFTTSNRESIIVRLFTFCVEHHSLSMRKYCISTDLLNKILVLLKSRHQCLALYALKFLQRVIMQKDDFYVRYIVREKAIDPVIECFKKNGTRYNVINSAILNIFDFIKTEDIRPLVKYVVENFMDVVESVNYVKTFKEIKIRYDQHRDREETMSIRSEDNSMASPRSFKKDRQEDQWFEDDDDTEIGTMLESIEKDVVTVQPKKEETTARKTGIEPMFPSLLKRKNAFDEDEAPVFGGGAASTLPHQEKKIIIKVNKDRSPSKTPSPATSPRDSPGPSREDEVTSSQNNSKENSPSPTPTIKSLVDYDESDSDEEVPSPDAVPSSSTGSPEGDKTEKSDGKKSDSPEYNSDVSSTSCEDKEERTESSTTEANRKRTSDGLDPIDVKRCRTDETTSEA